MIEQSGTESGFDPHPEDRPDEGPAKKSEAAESTEPSEMSPDQLADDELESLRDALAGAEQELAQHREAVLRIQAETENLRKRLIRDQERSRQFVLERFMGDLLPVLDSFEHGLAAAETEATVESLREGKLLILKMLTKVVNDHGLEVVDPVGEAFDPEAHEAMTMQPSEEHEENTVIAVLQKGYRLNDRLIRPARVVVSTKS